MNTEATFAAWSMLVVFCVGCQRATEPSAKPVPSTSPVSSAQAAPSATAAPSVTAAPAASARPVDSSRSWSFDQDQVGASPAGFAFGRTGSGALGRWQIRAEPDAPSPPHVLAQLDPDATGFRFPVAVVSDLSLRDLRASVRCKPVSGRVDQACGLVFRYLDENNYYITRANTLESNTRLYHVKGGKRTELASVDGAVQTGKWHELGIEARGEAIKVFWNGTAILDHRDKTFAGAGRVGLWTKADSISYYDDLRVEELR
jgi:hypothetical protein